MVRGMRISCLALALVAWAAAGRADDNANTSTRLTGIVTDESGKPMQGVMVSAIDAALLKSVTVCSQPDGKFTIDGLDAKAYDLRARLIGCSDESMKGIKASPTSPKGVELQFKMKKASKEELDMQRTGDDRIAQLQPKMKDAEAFLNFKQQCTYCHQVGTQGFRTPEEPVDWEVMITRMDGWGGLHKDTQKMIIPTIVATYGPDAEKTWKPFVPPPAPSGDALKAVVTEWQMSREDASMMHDLEIGADGLAYSVDMINDCLFSLDPKTGERQRYALPGGKDPDSTDVPILGPHSIERGPNGELWMTLALSGKMGKFDPKTKEWKIVMSGENDRRGFYPHTLRVAKDGNVWYTDAAMNSVFKLDGQTYKVKRYELKKATDVVTNSGGRGEGGGIVPYGIDIAPDGKIWYAKLNGQRLGVINPATDEIKEWHPPVYGPRRFAVAADGIVWIPGFASGDLASFDPKNESWKTFKLPCDGNLLPYALNVHPTTGDVWICGTGNDSMIRFNPKTGDQTVIRMPTRVTYTREVEFDKDGNVWICNSNYPSRHVENHHGSLIKIAMSK